MSANRATGTSHRHRHTYTHSLTHTPTPHRQTDRQTHTDFTQTQAHIHTHSLTHTHTHTHPHRDSATARASMQLRPPFGARLSGATSSSIIRHVTPCVRVCVRVRVRVRGYRGVGCEWLLRNGLLRQSRYRGTTRLQWTLCCARSLSMSHEQQRVQSAQRSTVRIGASERGDAPKFLSLSFRTPRPVPRPVPTNGFALNVLILFSLFPFLPPSLPPSLSYRIHSNQRRLDGLRVHSRAALGCGSR
jgi:hypothetical protein